MRAHLSFANVISALALFIALGGGAYAASLPRNSVGTQQLKGNAVTSAKVKDGSLQRADFAAGQIPTIQGTVRGETGAVGPQGERGATGAQGPKGDSGAAGLQGETGARGLQGLKGDTGAPGLKGDKGDPGVKGDPGSAGTNGSPGAAGTDGIGLDGFFGTGAAGNSSPTSNFSLTGDTYFENLTLGPGVNVNTQGHRLFVAGTLTLGTNSRIFRDGNPASGNVPGAAHALAELGGGGAGGPASADQLVRIAPGVTNSLGGSGFTGGAPAGSTASPVAATEGGTSVLTSAAQALTGRSLDGERITGGAGGGGAAGGGGGGGGGVVVVAARTIVMSGTGASITANGGNGNGGGGGGGGGAVIVVSTSPKPSTLALTATGGTPAGIAGRTFYVN